MYVEGLNTSFMWLAAYPGLSFHENRRFCMFFTRNVVSVCLCFSMCWLFYIYAYSLITAGNSHDFMNYFSSGSGFLLAAAKTLCFFTKRVRIRECLEILRPDFLKCVNHNLSKHKKMYNSGLKECNTCLLYTSRCV